MNDEEKKALEQLKYMNEDGCEKCVYGEDKTCINCWEAHKEIILNLIEKQDKMINEMAEMLVKVPEPLDDDVHTLAVIRYINEHLEEKKQQVIEYFSKKVGE